MFNFPLSVNGDALFQKPMAAPAPTVLPMLNIGDEMKKRGIIDQAAAKAQLDKETEAANAEGRDAVIGTTLGSGIGAFLTAMNGGDAEAFVRNINPSLQGLLGYGKYLAGLKSKSMDRYNSALKMYHDAFNSMMKQNNDREMKNAEFAHQDEAARIKAERDAEVARIRADRPDPQLTPFVDKDGNPSGYVFDKNDPEHGKVFTLPGAQNKNEAAAKEEITRLEKNLQDLNLGKAKATAEKDGGRRAEILKGLGISSDTKENEVGKAFDEEALKTLAQIHRLKSGLGWDVQYIEDAFKRQGRDISKYTAPGERKFIDSPKPKPDAKKNDTPPAAPAQKKSINIVGNVKQAPKTDTVPPPPPASTAAPDTAKEKKGKTLGIFDKYKK